MESLGLNLGYLVIQLFNLLLVTVLPLTLALFVYRWMTQVTRHLEDLRRGMDDIADRLDALTEFFTQRER